MFDALGVSLPVLAAPMAGGPTTPALVSAAARAGSLGFLAAGYLSADEFAKQLRDVHAETETFGVNVFAPNPLAVDPVAFRRYAELLQSDADVYGLDLRDAQPIEDDDAWRAKIDVLLADHVPVASFTFGIPSRDVITALQRVGTRVLQTVTSVEEARAAAEAGIDGLVVQASAAGGHSGTLTPTVLAPPIPLPELVASVRAAVLLPVVAAGGVGSADDIRAAFESGADAVAVGTLLLRTPEAGTSAPYRAALVDPLRTETVVTRAFTGRPARGLRNTFTERHTEHAPSGYPALHHLTRPIRRAAAKAEDAERINLWAGTGWRHGTDEPVETVLAGLSAAL